ncbi:hypothetical protein [Kordia zhangzhouensis]|uniref:hypothetical protein n=1 Tax=Kordia zhangzhouensis TaxID=1620405 RepID=UPI000629B990|nr:hypothetical protein [Kordia zhangzhouensis]
MDPKLNPSHTNGRLQIKKAIYNKALKSFIKDAYGSGVHFGNMDNNLKEILIKLSLNDVMEGTVKLPSIDVNTLTAVNDQQNEFSDFNLYDNFVCTFYAKEGVSYDEFMKGIEKLKAKLLDTYNKEVHQEILEKDHETRLMMKKREIKEIIFFVLLAILALIFIYFFSKK